jgi:hypothetical protein
MDIFYVDLHFYIVIQSTISSSKTLSGHSGNGAKKQVKKIEIKRKSTVYILKLWTNRNLRLQGQQRSSDPIFILIGGQNV